MAGRTNIMLSDDIRERLSELRKRAANPSMMDMGLKVGVSSSTIRTAMSGYSVKWKTYLGILEALNATEQEIQDFRNAWIISKTAVMPEVSGPLWAQELHKKLDLIIEMLEKHEKVQKHEEAQNKVL